MPSSKGLVAPIRGSKCLYWLKKTLEFVEVMKFRNKRSTIIHSSSILCRFFLYGRRIMCMMAIMNKVICVVK